ncbi:PREDICTED: uncharacterized protein LOC105363886 [Ceratosolen solmsi marchali]|uniref:Uncharacterized protein LOC105363886 n=1 Tax=Ceratosolen solmsi marchali TaxID=326594 RepID=A0AAJ6YL01_9HYME|nr:PREDICTED: uncharacterized protein LOC105363886 [Ceratosolen solmsi marchali]
MAKSENFRNQGTIIYLATWLCLEAVLGQYAQQTTPVPILKQINRYNEDGSYSYGYEGADGTYKIESKYPSGEVYGKYGFLDDTGSLREVEYGASKRGFEPTGTDINVPPPTILGNSLPDGKTEPDDDGQYREDPSVYYTDPKYTNGERYEAVSRIYPLQTQRSDYKPMPRYKPLMPHYHRLAAVRQDQLNEYPEYQPQYRTQYQYRPVALQVAQLQPRYKPIPYRYTGTAPPGVVSYSVNYSR